MAPAKAAKGKGRGGVNYKWEKKRTVISGFVSKPQSGPSQSILDPVLTQINPVQGTLSPGDSSSVVVVRGLPAPKRRTRSSSGGDDEPLALELPSPTRKRVHRDAPGIELWCPVIPPESKLRTDKFRCITTTMLWPEESSLEAEAGLYGHFMEYASQIGGWVPLQTKGAINSQFGAYYSGIVRYNDFKHRQASLNRNVGNRPVHHYLKMHNASLSSAIQDVRFYLGRYNLPLAVLVGEGQSWIRYPHCACIIFRFYNGKWQAIIKDCTNVDNRDVRPITKSILTALGFKTAFLVPLSKKESERSSINCLGQGLHAAASILDGKLKDLCDSGPKTMIFEYDFEEDCFMTNKLKGIPMVQKHFAKLQPVKKINSEEIRTKLDGFRKRVTEAGAEFINFGPADNSMEYEVESITDKRIKNHKLFYWVNWKGYGAEEQCWEPVEHLESCKELVKQFDIWYESQLIDRRKKRENRLTLRIAKPEWFH